MANYEEIRAAVLARRREVEANPERAKPRRGRPRKVDAPPAVERQIASALEHGRDMAERLGHIELQTRLLRAEIELDHQKLRAKQMKDRLRLISPPQDLTSDDGLAWIARQLGEIVLAATHTGDFNGAVTAAKVLAVLTGHTQVEGGNGPTIHFDLATMVQKLDQEERHAVQEGEEPKLLEATGEARDPAL